MFSEDIGSMLSMVDTPGLGAQPVQPGGALVSWNDIDNMRETEDENREQTNKVDLQAINKSPIYPRKQGGSGIGPGLDSMSDQLLLGD